MLHTPSAFNTQSTRALILLGDEHKKLWNDVNKPAVKAVASPEAWPASEQKLTGFENAYGTVSRPIPSSCRTSLTPDCRFCSSKTRTSSLVYRRPFLPIVPCLPRGASILMACMHPICGSRSNRKALVPIFSITVILSRRTLRRHRAFRWMAIEGAACL